MMQVSLNSRHKRSSQGVTRRGIRADQLRPAGMAGHPRSNTRAAARQQAREIKGAQPFADHDYDGMSIGLGARGGGLEGRNCEGCRKIQDEELQKSAAISTGSTAGTEVQGESVWVLASKLCSLLLPS